MSEKKKISSYPVLLTEWDWEKNNAQGIHPDDISIGSTIKVHWKCSLDHQWEATPNNRSHGQSCPVCAGRKVEVGFNDLASKHPDIANSWHPTNNNDLLPTQVTSGSHKRVWWLCKECGNEWQTSVANRVAGKGCPVCSRKRQGLVKEQNHIKKEGSFASHHPELLTEWDYEKNVVNLEEITKNSRRKIWWNCPICGHSWETTVSHRTVRNQGCPACANKTATSKNCLATTHPHILESWNYKRNISITPMDVTAGSNKKVWWICEKGHEWQSSVQKIVSGGVCPVCCGQRVEVGYNDLATLNPELAKEWHPVKNGNLLPTHFTPGSSKVKIWWLCPKGHEYQATIANRTNGTGCPICKKEQKTSFPEQAIYYYLGKITSVENRYLYGGKTEIDVYLPDYKIGIEYDGYYYHTSHEALLREQKKDNFLLTKGITIIRVKEVKDLSLYHDTDKLIYCRNTGDYSWLKEVILKILERLPITNNYILDIDFKRDSSDIMSQYIQTEKENSLAEKHPEIASEWHPTRNGYIKPTMVSYSSAKKVWWLGKCGHEWQSSIDSRITGIGCPICSNKKVLEGFNDLATTHPLLASEWDHDKNGSLFPNAVTFGSDKKVWWRCKKGHSYQSTISNRYYGKKCPYCTNTKVLKGYSDLASQFPAIAEEWNYNKNQETPDTVLPGSNKKVWWKCKVCGHEWMTNPNHRVYRHSGCPACSGRVSTPTENLLISNPELCKEWNKDRNSKNPSEYRPHSNQKVWWICSVCGYEWKAQISERSNGTGCPCCAGKKIVQGINDLVTMRPNLIPEWNYEKNIAFSPTNVTIGSHKKVWWKCLKCNHEWQASIANRSKGRGCPMCAKKTTAESKEKPIFQYNPYGAFIKEHPSIKKAQENTGLKKISPSSEKKKTAGGFIWLLEKDDGKALKIASTINHFRTTYKKIPVLQYSLDGTFLKKYSSSGEAERQNNIAISKVGACCRGKRKTAGGFIWKYDIAE